MLALGFLDRGPDPVVDRKTGATGAGFVDPTTVVELRTIVGGGINVPTIDPYRRRPEEALILNIGFRHHDLRDLDASLVLVRNAARQVDRRLTVRAALEIEHFDAGRLGRSHWSMVPPFTARGLHAHRHTSISMLVNAPQSSAADAACCEPLALGPTHDAEQLVEIVKALGDPVRLQIIDVLKRHGQPVCVCDLQPLFDITQPTLSHHLKRLREAGLVRVERRQQWAFYSLVPERMEVLAQWLS